MKKQFIVSLVAGFVLLGFATIFFFASPNPSKMSRRLDDLEFRAGSDYAEEWKRVDSLQNQGLTKDALALVNSIYDKASAEHNDPQIVKALLHIMKYSEMVDEEAMILNIERMNAELAKAKFPLKPVLHSILAEHYQSYYLNNSWRFQNRTELAQVVENDPRTWDINKIVRTAREHYLASILEQDSLQRTKITYFDPILVKYRGSEIYRPTLYDLLMQRALAFFMNESFSLTEPAYAFVLEGNAGFGDDNSFLGTDFASQDTFSHKRLAMILYQQLTRFHQGDPTLSAGVFVAMDRLAYARSISSNPDKDSLYRMGLETLLERSRQEEVGTWVAYRLGQYWVDQASKYDPLAGDAHKGNNLKAIAVMQPFVDVKGEFSAGSNCSVLIQHIRRKELRLSLENVAQPNRPALALANYRNLERIHFRVAPVTKEFVLDLQSLSYEEQAAKVRSLKPVKAWDIKTPEDPDLNPHGFEFPIPALPAGHYVIMSSDMNDMENSTAGLSFEFFWRSDLAFMGRQLPYGKMEFTVTDRGSGKPLSGVKAQIWAYDYDYDKSRYVHRKQESYTSDASGMFTVDSRVGQSRSFYVEFTHNGQRLYTNDNWYQYRYDAQPDPSSYSTQFFTDRGIYRPGQTVYFKGILLAHQGDRTSIRANARTTVAFYDVNSQKVSELDLTSNEYGTVSGSFTAPQGLLNGMMRIEDNHGSAYFSVEDYKRPKFEVLMDPVKGSFRLNEQVKVSGKAMAYAGSNVDGAQVKYRVVRTASYPYCYWPWWRPRPSSPSMEITHGSTQTDELGRFNIEFQAIPDKKVTPESKPQYSYEVYVDVIDITGETHSSSASVAVGYVALSASIGVEEMIKVGEEKYLSLSTRNLNGEFESAAGRIKVYRLKSPSQVYKPRLWSMPDKFVFGEAEFRREFPNDLYRDENDRSTWAKEATALDVAFDTEKEDSIDLGKLKGWKPGVYRAEMETKDKFGTPVSVQREFVVYEAPSNQAPTNALLQVIAEKPVLEPGQEAVMVLSTGADSTEVLYEIERKGKVVRREWLKLDKGTKIIKIPVEEGDRGNFAAHFTTVRDGRYAAETQTIYVPWSNKELKLEFATFRDKLWPGQKEEWTLKVTGPKGEKVAAELLAGMYDASLDAFRSVYWGLNLDPTYYPQLSWTTGTVFSYVVTREFAPTWQINRGYYSQSFDYINMFGYYMGGGHYYGYYRTRNGFALDIAEQMDESIAVGDTEKESPAPVMAGTMSDLKDKSPREEEGGEHQKNAETKVSGELGGDEDGKRGGQQPGPVQIRTNLNETAFFFPQLRTNEKGEVILSFTIPEALTRWRMMAFAHTQDLKTGYAERSVVTQKDLMVMPNPPRFFRESDKIVFSAKVSNLAETDLSGTATLELFDALTMKPIDAALGNSSNSQGFTAKKGQSAALGWSLKIPAGIQAVTYRVIAKAGSFSDGEEASLPVLTNSMLVTESLPLPVRAKQTKTFTLDKLVSNSSTTLRHQQVTLEFTSNPAWYAVQALPYMMEYPYECIEQTFSRYYANSLASHVASSHPRIKQVFDNWASAGNKESLLSNLEKNQELKALLLEETPWVLQSQNESERKKRVGLLFDLNRMANEQAHALKKLEKAQVSNGAWPWFPGMPESHYITQHVVTGMGHLDRLGVKEVRQDKGAWNMVEKAVRFLDQELKRDYEALKRDKVDLTKMHISQTQVHYLYGRSFFKDISISGGAEEAFKYYFGQAQKYWLSFERYSQGMIALVLNRAGETAAAKGIIKSLDQNSIKNEEMGMYWKDNTWGYFWYQAPIETQALLIEAFSEVSDDRVAVEEMKLWLLKQKQTQDWKTTKATAEACFALLLSGTDLLSQSQIAEVSVGGQRIDPGVNPALKTEAGTGYFKTSWSATEVKPEMGKVTVKNPNEVAAWGALYWQYFEQLDKITFAKTNLQLRKELYLQEDTDTGPKLIPLKAGQAFKPGDRVKVRIVLVSDRDMEYVHLKDMRAAGFEPVDVISRYRWQDGLGYYQSTRDAATNFFIDYLRKGTYVFEYMLRATHQGDFSNGITTLQCMYAPEFTAHSEGVRVQVGK